VPVCKTISEHVPVNDRTNRSLSGSSDFGLVLREEEMSSENAAVVIEDIYKALANNNEDIDLHITRLKNWLAASDTKQAVFDPARLAQNNRAGRKLMQAYFKKRGVAVVFK
jgi:hypothetical protein